MKKAIVLIFLFYIIVSMTSCSKDKQVPDNTDTITKEEYEKAYDIAVNTPYGKYPETIYYTLGKMTGSNNSNMPAPDTYEDNTYTRYLREKLNIQNINVIEEEDSQYNSFISMLIAAKELPDIFIISDYKELKFLIENDMVEDLTDVYEKCASDRIKDIYESYPETIWENVLYDGKIMAIPETNISNGPNLLWLRKDWLDKLSLKEPKTLEEALNIIEHFVKDNPGENEEGTTVGLVCDSVLSGGFGYSYEYLLDIVFASYGAYPKQWIEDENGNIVYGSVQDSVKEALIKLKDMYDRKILDNDFLFRTNTNIIELIKNGQCGSFFGPWWAPNNPLMEAKKVNPDSEWVPYLIATDDEGNTSYYSENPSYKYVAVRKGYENPEIAIKIISVLFDLARSEETSNDEFKMYYQINVDPTARPLAINVDYYDALQRCYENITAVFAGKLNACELPFLEASYYESALNYINNKENATVQEWAAYASRLQACALISKDSIKIVESKYFGETKTMENSWWRLSELEHEAYIKIITGEEPISYFEEFRKLWYELGGKIITEEVRSELNED